jgi:hypothetical protein
MPAHASQGSFIGNGKGLDPAGTHPACLVTVGVQRHDSQDQVLTHGKLGNMLYGGQHATRGDSEHRAATNVAATGAANAGAAIDCRSV